MQITYYSAFFTALYAILFAGDEEDAPRPCAVDLSTAAVKERLVRTAESSSVYSRFSYENIYSTRIWGTYYGWYSTY